MGSIGTGLAAQRRTFGPQLCRMRRVSSVWGHVNTMACSYRPRSSRTWRLIHRAAPSRCPGDELYATAPEDAWDFRARRAVVKQLAGKSEGREAGEAAHSGSWAESSVFSRLLSAAARRA